MAKVTKIRFECVLGTDDNVAMCQFYVSALHILALKAGFSAEDAVYRAVCPAPGGEGSLEDVWTADDGKDAQASSF